MSYCTFRDASKSKLLSLKNRSFKSPHIRTGTLFWKGLYNQEDLNLFLLEPTYSVEKFKHNHLQTVLPKIIYQLRLGKGEGVRNQLDETSDLARSHSWEIAATFIISIYNIRKHFRSLYNITLIKHLILIYKYNLLTYPLHYFTALLEDERYSQDHLDLDYLQPFICNFSSRPWEN